MHRCLGYHRIVCFEKRMDPTFYTGKKMLFSLVSIEKVYRYHLYFKNLLENSVNFIVYILV